jgi:hypothetical protein
MFVLPRRSPDLKPVGFLRMGMHTRRRFCHGSKDHDGLISVAVSGTPFGVAVEGVCECQKVTLSSSYGKLCRTICGCQLPDRAFIVNVT